MANKTHAPDTILTIEGRNWRVINVGHTDPDSGKTFYHLACTGRQIQQKNGGRPRMVGVWLDAPTT